MIFLILKDLFVAPAISMHSGYAVLQQNKTAVAFHQ